MERLPSICKKLRFTLQLNDYRDSARNIREEKKPSESSKISKKEDT